MKRLAQGCLLLLGALGPAGCGSSGGASGPTPGPSATPASSAAGTPVSGIPALQARLVVSGLQSPLDLQSVPSDPERVYVVEQSGRIRVVRSGQLQVSPFLDIASRLSFGGERGLLGLAFHPQFATNRRFFVNYTDPAGDTHISEFRASSADASSLRRAISAFPALIFSSAERTKTAKSIASRRSSRKFDSSSDSVESP